MKLLLIDDDIVDRMNAVRLLKNSGKEIFISETNSAEMGIKMAQEKDYDLILLDYQLPGMNGLEVLPILQNQDHCGTAVVMLSHSDDDELALKCIRSGAQDYVKKSEVTTSRLVRAIMHAQQRYKMERQLRISKEQLRQLAETDSLTGLANRYTFEVNLRTALNSASRHGYSLALLMLDLDKFKQINDTMGHLTGDELLVAVGDRLIKEVRHSELLCRLGGDEFAILLHHTKGPAQARMLADRIQEAFQFPFTLKGVPHTITFSIGIAMYPDCADCPEQLMKCADIAMYRSKESGRNQVNFYSKAVHQKVLKRVALENFLFEAWRNSMFEIYYQPQLSVDKKHIVGMEALIRCNHPQNGLVEPEEFIPVAEEIGMIHQIGLWVLETACAQWRQWYQSVPNPPSISVNVSAVQLCDASFFDQLKQILERYQIPANNLELELTESYLDNSDQAARLLENIASLGVKLALDDFGTGFASLANLRRHPFSILKVDRSFVKTIEDKNSDSTFLVALIAFANKIGYETVAEGVESEAQYRVCKLAGVDRIQGYYFDKPLAKAEFEAKWLKPKS